MNNKERRANKKLYIYSTDILLEHLYSSFWIKIYNHSIPYNLPKFWFVLKMLGVKAPFGTCIEPPVFMDYGKNITIGKAFYANTGCTFCDAAKITIGDHVLLGPHVSIFTPGHPIHPKVRATSLEYALPVTIGDHVWIGGNTCIMPGVTIGSNVVIGGGSVVTKDIPDGVVAAGNPCRVIREITDKDMKYAYKGVEIDPEALEEIERRMKQEDKRIPI